MDERFLRTAMLIGESGLATLKEAKVLVCGLGGVGSYTAEALGRSGIGSLRLVDFDRVTATNINRQLPALSSTLGRLKTEIMAERLKDINPNMLVEALPLRISGESLVTVLQGEWDYVADAIDDVEAKVHLASFCRQQGLPLISSMGAGNKLDPTLVQVADISQTYGCPLAKVMRRKLRQQGITQGIKTVFSPELPPPTKSPGSTPASMAFVPGTFGLTIAAVIVRDLVAQQLKEDKV